MVTGVETLGVLLRMPLSRGPVSGWRSFVLELPQVHRLVGDGAHHMTSLQAGTGPRADQERAPLL